MSWRLFGAKPTEASVVPLLLQRLRTTTTIADKRDALAQLAEVPGKELQLVGGDGLVLLLETLVEFQHDLECIKRVLEVLQVLTDDESSTGGTLDLLVQDGLRGPVVLLELLKKDDFYVRFPTVQLLTKLLQHNAPAAIAQILTDPNAIMALVSVLDDPRESVRNEGLLLLKALVASDTEMQKIVSFTNAFESLFKIITDEGGANGSIVVEDSLAVIAHLVRNDVSQRSFREMGFCRQLGPLLRFPANSGNTGRRMSAVAQSVLQIVLLLLQGSASKESELKATKKEICDSHLLQGILGVAFNGALTAKAQVQGLKTLAVLVADDQPCQAGLLGFVQETEQGPVSALLGLVQYLLQRDCEEHHFYAIEVLRRALATPEAQMSIVSSVRNIGSGVLTCGQLLASEMLSFSASRQSNSYFASITLTMSLHGNAEAKEALLGAAWETSTFMACFLRFAMQMIRERSDFAVAACLRVLLTWMAQCPPAVLAFVEDKGAFLFVTQSAVSGEETPHVQALCALALGLACVYYPAEPPTGTRFKKPELFDHLVRKLGFDQFTHKWRQLCSTEEYRQPSLYGQPGLYDDQYVSHLRQWYAAVDGFVQQQISSPEALLQMADGPAPLRLGDDQLHRTIASYQQLVKSQEEKVAFLQAENERLTRLTTEARTAEERTRRDTESLMEAKAQYQQQLDTMTASARKQDETIARQARELAELRKSVDQLQKQLEEEIARAAISKSMSEENINSLTHQLQSYEHELQSLTQTYAMLEQALTAKDREISHLYAGGAVPAAPFTNGDGVSGEEAHGPDVAELLILIGQMDEQLHTYLRLLHTHGVKVSGVG
eukprot:GGOE01041669.1.p1 GENE.GGOE01041669.1~~GGOE01041669.1.p1  ORF type:complete len:835 (-),score=288.33 GGOE01041669.1:95-2599(-)